MKSTGIVRKMDELGRFVIPMELRRTLGIGKKDQLEVFVDGDHIILRKYAPGCFFCGSANNLEYVLSKQICRSCTTQIAQFQHLRDKVKAK